MNSRDGWLRSPRSVVLVLGSTRNGACRGAVLLWLSNRGVVTEKYPFVADQELGIWTAPSGDQVAWFKDPDGNVLSVSRHS